VSLHEYGGEIVGANRGMIEYDDLLKRPLEHYKYLLTTVERAALAMTNTTLFLDLAFIGSSNDIHLAAFREIPDFQSFKGRIELVRVPFILDVRHEEALYRERLREAAGKRHIAPHTAYVAALWAVLSRMRKPQIERYPSTLAEVIGKLSPLDKAELYSTGQVPRELAPDRARELAAHIKDLWHESDTYPIYEGRVGASPREMQGVLLAAAAAGGSRYEYVSPMAVLDEIVDLCKQASLYEFLRQDVQPGGYHDHKKLVDVARGRLFDKIDDEVRAAVGLVEESEYGRVFDRYITHVMHAIKKEKVRNPQTGRTDDPDEGMMKEVERTPEAGPDRQDRRMVARPPGPEAGDVGDLQRPASQAARCVLRAPQEDDREGDLRSGQGALGQRGQPVGRFPRARRVGAADADRQVRIFARVGARSRRCARVVALSLTTSGRRRILAVIPPPTAGITGTLRLSPNRSVVRSTCVCATGFSGVMVRRALDSWFVAAW